MTVQFRWPLGMPLVDHLGSGIWEVRSKLPTRIARTLFFGAVALKVNDLMKQQRMNKSAMAARMRTSRAAVHRLLDPENTSVTLATLNRAARSLGRKVKIELVPA